MAFAKVGLSLSGTARSIVGGSTSGGNTEMVDEGVGVAVIELEGVGEADSGGVGVVEGAGEIIGDGEGDGVAAA